jgi:hypothetical protein
LSLAHGAMTVHPKLGACGGPVTPVYEAPPPAWFHALGLDLACRDLGEAELWARWEGAPAAERTYPPCAPIGAGMVIRKAAYAAYVDQVAASTGRTALGRRGGDLSSGEDNDMVMTLLEQGWSVAYLPELRVEHLIPAARLTCEYLARYAYSTNRTWVQVLAMHGLRPWPPIAPWTSGLRKARAWMRGRPWRTPADFIRWRANGAGGRPLAATSDRARPA